MGRSSSIKYELSQVVKHLRERPGCTVSSVAKAMLDSGVYKGGDSYNPHKNAKDWARRRLRLLLKDGTVFATHSSTPRYYLTT